VAASTMKGEISNLEDRYVEGELRSALQEAQARHVILRLGPRGALLLWAPGRRVPSRTRQLLRQHHKEIRTMIGRHEAMVCPSPVLHRRFWEPFAGRMSCKACARVERGWRRAKASEQVEVA
jgi:hypothetical protein